LEVGVVRHFLKVSALLLIIPTAVQAAIISFDFTYGTSGMAATDQAGAPGVRAANYNNVGITSTSTAVSLTTVKDNSGSTLSGVTMTFTPGSSTVTPGAASGTNDTNLFSNFYDEFGAPAAQVQVTNIPFAQYDVYFYRNGVESNAATREGQFTIGAQNRFVRGGLANPDSSGNGYVRSNDTTDSGGSTTQGNYVVFSGLSGSTLNASFVGTNAGDTTLRNKVVGFQIVEVPEPSIAGLIFTAAAAFLVRRRQRLSTSAPSVA
jgi:hypothetical protein